MCCAIPERAFSQESDEGAPSETRWLVDLGIGPRAGGCFLSGPTNGRKFIRGAALGAELDWGVFAHGSHRAVLSAGFLIFTASREKGPAALTVESKYARVDWAAGYDFTWRLLVVGVDVGMALAVNTVRTSYGQPGWEVNGGEIAFTAPENPDVKERVGADPGFLAGLELGLEIGELWGVEDLLEFRVKSDYVLRGARNELTLLGVIALWPTAWFR
jgi:hypothetical protein